MSSKLIIFPSQSLLTDIVRKALIFTVTDLGQISIQQRRELDRAVDARVLEKGRGGPYAALKTVWAKRGYDFAGEREAEIAALRYLETAFDKAA